MTTKPLRITATPTTPSYVVDVNAELVKAVSGMTQKARRALATGTLIAGLGLGTASLGYEALTNIANEPGDGIIEKYSLGTLLLNTHVVDNYQYSYPDGWSWKGTSTTAYDPNSTEFPQTIPSFTEFAQSMDYKNPTLTEQAMTRGAYAAIIAAAAPASMSPVKSLPASLRENAAYATGPGIELLLGAGLAGIGAYKRKQLRVQRNR